MIQVDNLTRHYQSVTAVDNVSFSIQQGEVVGLLGHNGAGKTTVMKMITGFLAPSSGRITIDGHALPQAAHYLQSQLGYLPEVLPFYPEMTVIGFLDYIAAVRNIPRDSRQEAVVRAIHETDLQPKALAPIHTLSRGYKQRVGVASAIIHQPKILVLDEPTNGLDPEQTHHMRDLIGRLAKQATVIVSTHIMQEVEAMCSRVMILQNGKLMVDESLKALQQTQQVELAAKAQAKTLSELFKQAPEITDITMRKENEGVHYFTLNIAESAKAQEVVSHTARLLTEKGIEIYSIAPRSRDLEGIFKGLHSVERKHAS